MRNRAAGSDDLGRRLIGDRSMAAVAKRLAAAMMVVLAACGDDPSGPETVDGRDVLVVESNTYWRGGIFEPGEGARWVSGNGATEFPLDPSVVTCWAFEKLTEDGFLAAHHERRSRGSSTPRQAAATERPFGIIAQCSENL